MSACIPEGGRVAVAGPPLSETQPLLSWLHKLTSRLTARADTIGHDLAVKNERSGDGENTLRKTLGLLETTVGGVGIILGAGIYALVGEGRGKAGDAVWLSFLLAAVMAGVIGLSYAELAAAFPRAGADYEYTRQALGLRVSFVVGWLIVIGNLVAAATVSLGFGAT